MANREKVPGGTPPLGDIAIVGEAENGPSAIDLILRIAPDLVFLDL
jgi:chemotaxis response regulator CheB